jgi:hydroxymethylpyrimidine pyrophosphatase-like HAD family hydrolase
MGDISPTETNGAQASNPLGQSPETQERKNPYEHSTAVEKLKKARNGGKPLRMAFLDIDSTITGPVEQTNEVRELLEEQGYVVAYVTSRTEEMIMSEEQRNQTPTFQRPSPHLGIDSSGKRTYVKPEEIVPAGILDPDIIAGTTGTTLLLKQTQGGYQEDFDSRDTMRSESEKWRSGVLQLVDFINQEKNICNPISIDNPLNYYQGETDVYSPDFRIQLSFQSQSDKIIFKEKVRSIRKDLSDPAKKLQLLSNGITPEAIEQILNIRITDDSKPSENKYSAYLTPTRGYKTRAVETIVCSLCNQLSLRRTDLELLIAGDSYPDLGMGLYGGLDTKATFLLVGGSRLMDSLTEQSEEDRYDFAGEGISAIRRRLKGSQNGMYELKPPLNAKRTVILADYAYLQTKGPKSIIAHLNQKKTV